LTGKTTEFRGNAAGGRSNALHLKSNALINFKDIKETEVSGIRLEVKDNKYCKSSAGVMNIKNYARILSAA
jgi:hypothetical protein